MVNIFNFLFLNYYSLLMKYFFLKKKQILLWEGLGARDADSGIVRSNYPIPDKVGIFYFEVEIISKGRDG